MQSLQNSRSAIWFGFNLKTHPGVTLQPKFLELWSPEEFKKTSPEEPFLYHTDALVGLSLLQFYPHLKNPFATPKMNYSFGVEAWRILEPHVELYQKSQQRIQSLRKSDKKSKEISGALDYFERNFTEIVENCCHPKGFDISALAPLIEAINFLESKIDSPLIYNFNIHFKDEINQKLKALFSFLHSLRTLAALDHNSRVKDVTHEAIKVDSVNDYMSKADYIVNDSILYWKLKNQSLNWSIPHRQEALKVFKQYSHNGYCLIENLPSDFIKSLSTPELEEALYIVQMDWLLGTPSGLLFKIREELYGITEGYESIFWPELQSSAVSPPCVLKINCEVTEREFGPTQLTA